MYVYIYIYIECQSFRAESGKIGQPWVGNRGEFFQADAGAIFNHHPRNFQEHLRQKVGNGRGGGGGRGLRTYVHFHGVLKCIAISLFVLVSLDDF